MGVTLALAVSIVVVWAQAERGTGGTGYFSLSKAMTKSENDLPEESLTGGRLFGTSALMLDSVIACTPPTGRAVMPVRPLSWENVLTKPLGLSSVSRRLSREFRLR
jgi:hypothetical protein